MTPQPEPADAGGKAQARQRWSRFTIRRLMFLVALAALTLASGAWIHRRSLEFRAQSSLHHRRAVVLGSIFESDLGPPPWLPVSDALVNYHLELAEKYDHAARYPWLSVEPDPPSPE